MYGAIVEWMSTVRFMQSLASEAYQFQIGKKWSNNNIFIYFFLIQAKWTCCFNFTRNGALAKIAANHKHFDRCETFHASRAR